MQVGMNQSGINMIKELLKHKEFGKFFIDKEKLIENPIIRIPSGVFAFDLLTGGGIPRSRLTMFHGSKSCSKTTQSLRIANNFLTLFPNEIAIFIDMEGTYDTEWALNFIKKEYMDSRFFVVQPDYGEQGVDLIRELSMSEDVGLIVVDSLAMLIPTKDADAEAGDDFMGLQARLINKMFRKIIPIMSYARRNGRMLTFLLINQVRMNLKARTFAPSYTKPGGIMQDMVVSLDVKFYAGEYHKSGNIPMKVSHKFTIEKNKVTGALPKRSGEFSMVLFPHDGYNIGDVDDYKTVVEYAKRTGFLNRDGNKWFLGDNLTFKNQTELRNYLMENKESYTLLKDSALNASIENLLISSDDTSKEEVDSD